MTNWTAFTLLMAMCAVVIEPSHTDQNHQINVIMAFVFVSLQSMQMLSHCVFGECALIRSCCCVEGLYVIILSNMVLIDVLETHHACAVQSGCLLLLCLTVATLQKHVKALSIVVLLIGTIAVLAGVYEFLFNIHIEANRIRVRIAILLRLGSDLITLVFGLVMCSKLKNHHSENDYFDELADSTTMYQNECQHCHRTHRQLCI
jgi:hypothetical protein